MKTNKDDRFADVRTKMENLRKEMLKIGQAAFAEETKTIFEEFSTLTAFSWTQYTPYFNDGDTCTFSVNTYDIGIQLESMVGFSKDGYETDDEDEETVANNEELLGNISAVVEDFLSSIDETVMLQMFGDHAEVIISRDGTTEVNDYEHD